MKIKSRDKKGTAHSAADLLTIELSDGAVWEIREKADGEGETVLEIRCNGTDGLDRHQLAIMSRVSNTVWLRGVRG